MWQHLFVALLLTCAFTIVDMVEARRTATKPQRLSKCIRPGSFKPPNLFPNFEVIGNTYQPFRDYLDETCKEEMVDHPTIGPQHQAVCNDEGLDVRHCMTTRFWNLGEPIPDPDGLCSGPTECNLNVNRVHTYAENTAETNSRGGDVGRDFKSGGSLAYSPSFNLGPFSFGATIKVDRHCSDSMKRSWEHSKQKTVGFSESNGQLVSRKSPELDWNECGEWHHVPTYQTVCGYVAGTMIPKTQFFCANELRQLDVVNPSQKLEEPSHKAPAGHAPGHTQPIFVRLQCDSHDPYGPEYQVAEYNQVMVWVDWMEWYVYKHEQAILQGRYDGVLSLQGSDPHVGPWFGYVVRHADSSIKEPCWDTDGRSTEDPLNAFHAPSRNHWPWEG